MNNMGNASVLSDTCWLEDVDDSAGLNEVPESYETLKYEYKDTRWISYAGKYFYF
jgi:hypothetical protein